MDLSLRSKGFKEKRQRQLIRSLSALRVDEKADIVLVCGERKFPVHKLMLEASSPYFVTMFAKGGAELVKTGKVVFNTMAPETLEAILDFIYLGAVDAITTEEQVMKVSLAASLMKLEPLVNYCCDALVSRVCKENFIELWDISTKCNHSDLKESVMAFTLEIFDEAHTAEDFASLSGAQIKDFFQFIKGKVICLDRFLECALKWLMHEVDDRENWADDLLTCFDAKFVSKDCTASILKNDVIMNSSIQIANSINKLAVAVFLYDCIQNEKSSKTTIKTKCAAKETLVSILLYLANAIEKLVEYCRSNYAHQWINIRKAFFIFLFLFVFLSVCSLRFTGVMLWVIGFLGGGLVFRQEIIEARQSVKSADVSFKSTKKNKGH